MKKYIGLIFLIALFACQEDDLVWYSQEGDALHFYIGDETTDVLERSFNFAFANVMQDDGNYYYYGDSLDSWTYSGRESIVLELQGFPSPDERRYRLKTVLVKGQDSTKVAEVLFEDYYSLNPNQTKDTIQLTILRPPTRGTYVVGITVDTAGNDAFFKEMGTAEQSVYRLEVKDTYEEPSAWRYRTEWLGEFSEEKYAFMVTFSHKLFSETNNHMWNETDIYNMELRNALETFNATAAPEDRKTFTFPVTTKPTWWDGRKDFLGEFSEEKHDFVKEVVAKYEKEGILRNDDKLAYWNLIFREELERSGRSDIEFPVYERMIFWWKSEVLGDEWSVEKQEFVIRELLPRINFRVTSNTWAFAGSILRMALDRHNIENPKEELKYNFPAANREPEWWSTFEENYFGKWSQEKEDLLVDLLVGLKASENGNTDEVTIDFLLEGQKDWVGGKSQAIIAAVEAYNKDHKDQLELPGAGGAAPSWWKNLEDYIGEYSEEKEKFIQEIVENKYGGYYNEWQKWEVWNIVLRWELAAYNDANKEKPYNFTFPVPEEIKLRYWDELPYLGKWSETKQAFVVMTCIPLNYGSADLGWYMGAPSEWGYSSSWPDVHKALTEAYKKEYDNFMKTYSAMEPEFFEFPEEY